MPCELFPSLGVRRLLSVNFSRGPSIDVSYQVSVHLAKRFQKRAFKKIGQSEPRIAYGGHVCWWIGTKSAIFREDLHHIFSPPCQMPCELFPSLGVRRLLSVNFSHFNLHLWNSSVKWSETRWNLQKRSLASRERDTLHTRYPLSSMTSFSVLLPTYPWFTDNHFKQNTESSQGFF
jgi:hypothetical protein